MKIKFNVSSWEQKNLNTIFNIEYGNKFDKCNMVECADSNIAFVTRTAANNGVGTFVDEVDGVKPYPAGCLTVALGGSLGSTFLQPRPFYTAQNVAVLIPKDKNEIPFSVKFCFLITVVVVTSVLVLSGSLPLYSFFK